MPATRVLYLVRHGLPDYTGNKRPDEVPGPPLSSIGRAQLAQSAAFLRDISPPNPKNKRPPIAKPTSVYTSPLARAHQSAQILSAALNVPLSIAPDLKEWHRTDSLYGVTQRCARWFHQWLATGPQSAIVVSHGSPLLALIRTALYLPHHGWSILSTAERFEFCMGSIFEIAITPTEVTARRLFHPAPRIMHLRHGRVVASYPRPCSPPESCSITRPNLGRVIGFRDQ